MAKDKERAPPRFRGLRSVDAQIRQAEKDGAFDDLPGAGKPLGNLDEVYDPAWWTKKLVEREKISLLPPALELRKLVEKKLAEIGAMTREAQVRDALAELNAEIARRNRSVTSGPTTDIASLDIDAIVARWREER